MGIWKNANGNMLMILKIITNQNVVANGFFLKERRKRIKWFYAHSVGNHSMYHNQHQDKDNIVISCINSSLRQTFISYHAPHGHIRYT